MLSLGGSSGTPTVKMIREWWGPQLPNLVQGGMRLGHVESDMLCHPTKYCNFSTLSPVCIGSRLQKSQKRSTKIICLTNAESQKKWSSRSLRKSKFGKSCCSYGRNLGASYLKFGKKIRNPNGLSQCFWNHYRSLKF